MVTEVKPKFEFVDQDLIDDNLLDNIIENMTNMSGIYHKNSKELLPKEDLVEDEGVEEKEEEEVQHKQVKEKKVEADNNVDDIFGIGDSRPVEEIIQEAKQNDIFDIFGAGPTEQSEAADIFDSHSGVTLRRPDVLIASSQKASNGFSGLELQGNFHRENGEIYLGLQLHNKSAKPLGGLSISIEPNSFGISVSNEKISASIDPEAKQILKLPISLTNNNRSKEAPSVPLRLNATLETNGSTYNFHISFYVLNLFPEGKKLDQQTFKTKFGELKTKDTNITFSLNSKLEESELNALFERNNVFFTAKIVSKTPHKYYYTGAVGGKITFIIEVSLGDDAQLTVMCDQGVISPLIEESLQFILNQ